jgi:hypothetical protein
LPYTEIEAVFWLLPAFIGAGLLYAGIMDSCAMGMLLARMPWNRVGEQQNACGG